MEVLEISDVFWTSWIFEI